MHKDKKKGSAMKFGFIFPGYGGQFVGMAKEFYDHSRIMQEHFEEAANCLDKNFVKLCFASSDSTLTELENAYISLFLVSLSLNGILKEQGIIPSLVAGRDIGEYAALAAVDGITLPDAVYLLRKYSGLYQELLDQRKLTAINIFHVELETIKKACLECTNGNNLVTIAAYETDEQTLITGTNESINCLKKTIATLTSIPTTLGEIGGGLHSQLMDDLVKTMKMYLEKVDFKDSQVPFITSVTGQALTSGDAIRAGIMQQIHAPLQWKKVIDAFSFCDVIVIIGPSKELQKQLETAHPDKKVFTVVTLTDMNALLTFVGKEPLVFEHENE